MGNGRMCDGAGRGDGSVFLYGPQTTSRIQPGNKTTNLRQGPRAGGEWGQAGVTSSGQKGILSNKQEWRQKVLVQSKMLDPGQVSMDSFDEGC